VSCWRSTQRVVTVTLVTCNYEVSDSNPARAIVYSTWNIFHGVAPSFQLNAERISALGRQHSYISFAVYRSSVFPHALLCSLRYWRYEVPDENTKQVPPTGNYSPLWTYPASSSIITLTYVISVVDTDLNGSSIKVWNIIHSVLDLTSSVH